MSVEFVRRSRLSSLAQPPPDTLVYPATAKITFCEIIFAILLPPLAIYYKIGQGRSQPPEFMVCTVLWFLFLLPGCFYAIWIIRRADKHMPIEVLQHRDKINSPFRIQKRKKRPSDVLIDNDHMPIELLYQHPEQMNSPYKGKPKAFRSISL